MNKVSLFSTMLLIGCLSFSILGGCSATHPPKKKAVEKKPVAKKQNEAKNNVAQAANNNAQAANNNAAVENNQANVVIDADGSVSQENLDNFRKYESQQSLRGQQNAFLVNNYLKTAKKYADQEKYQDAYQFVQEALQLDPNNDEALGLKRLYGQRLGYRPDEVNQQLEGAVELEKVKIAQTRLEIDNRIAQGKRFMRQKEYAKAIPLFKQAKELLRWLPYNALNIKGKSRQIDFLVSRAEKAQKEQEEKIRSERLAAAQEQAKREEEARLRTVQERISNLFRQANIAFEREKYELADSFCNEITALDSTNAEAEELKSLINEARHAKIADVNRDRHKEEWRKVFAQIEETTVVASNNTIVVFPDYDTWKQKEKRSKREQNKDLEQDTPETRETKEKLQSEVLSMDFSEAPLGEVVDFLVTTTGINIIIDPAVAREFPEEQALQVDLTVNKLKLQSILDLILSLKGLAYRIDNGVIIISTQERVGEQSVLNIYDVRDLTGKLPDFPAPDINLVQVQGQDAASGVALVEEDEGPVGTITEEQLTDLIKENIAKATWDLADRSIDTRSGTLIIRQTPSVHKQLQALLNDLRKSTGLLVNIEVRFIEVSDDFLEEIGVDWRSLGAVTPGGGIAEVDEATARLDGNGDGVPDFLLNEDRGTDLAFRNLDDNAFDGGGGELGTGAGIFFQNGDSLETRQRIENVFDQTFGAQDVTSNGGLSAQIAYVDDIELQAILRAVRKQNRNSEIDTINLTVFNTQRANVSILIQEAYIQDFDVEIATNATIADPVIGTIQSGIVLDVRPIISADRKYITLELQPTLADADTRDFATQLANDNNNASEVIIQLPEVQMTKIKTTVTIPDGGTLLLGGLNELIRQDFVSGIPILSDIPILSFAGSKKGKFASRDSLLLLVRAKITSMEELEPKEGLNR